MLRIHVMNARPGTRSAGPGGLLRAVLGVSGLLLLGGLAIASAMFVIALLAVLGVAALGYAGVQKLRGRPLLDPVIVARTFGKTSRAPAREQPIHPEFDAESERYREQHSNKTHTSSPRRGVTLEGEFEKLP
jgi:hypothetical protein